MCNLFVLTSRAPTLTLGKITSAVRETSVSRHNGSTIMSPFKPLNTIVLSWSEGVSGGILNWAQIIAERFLSDSYASDRCCFSNLVPLQAFFPYRQWMRSRKVKIAMASVTFQNIWLTIKKTYEQIIIYNSIAQSIINPLRRTRSIIIGIKL